MKIIKSIQNRIYKIRGERVMIDKDLAALFGVDVNILKLTVKRHNKQFSTKSMFQLTEIEWEYIRHRIETIESSDTLRQQMVTLQKEEEQYSKFLPYAFTGQGVALLKETLSSAKYDIQLNQVYDAMENLLDENAAKNKWGERERIGFK
jgi:DNA-directed RNA polymerase subunit E'/Rpb7